ncbi:FHA domain-containing protein [Streptomyces sp. NPDC052701]|uniref:FHA domain-containing protein n=1 Tax=Streptomyces sp. NPDC052701 TaxID=3155533 RepID=UPI00342F0D9A
MQIRLTVVDPLGPPGRTGRAASCDVLVTAPAGTALAAVTSALASAVAGEGAAAREAGGPVVLYAGAQRLDAQRCTLGEPPLTDGAVLSVGAPGEPEPHPELDGAPARLQVVAGPDAGGVHLLHGGEIRVGRSADADVPLDDPDVSRLHCAVTVAADGRVSVADLGSTNGTTLDGRPVGPRPVRFAPGALLRIGESALRLAPAGGAGARVRTAPDGEGHVRVSGPSEGTTAHPSPGLSGTTHHTHGSADWAAPGPAAPRGHTPGEPHAVPEQGAAPRIEDRGADHRAAGAPGASGPASAGGGAPWVRATEADDARRAPREEAPRAPRGRGARQAVPGDGDTPAGRPGAAARTGAPAGAGTVPPARTAEGSAPRAAAPGGTAADAAPHPGPRPGAAAPAGGASHPPAPGDPRPGTAAPGGTGASGAAGPRTPAPGAPLPGPAVPGGTPPGTPVPGAPAARTPARDGSPGGVAASPGTAADGASPRTGPDGGRKGTPLRGTDMPQGIRRRGGLAAWARRLAGGRGEQEEAGREAYGEEPAGVAEEHTAAAHPVRETWPDPATLLLTALGPGPRLWERGPGHPEALAVRLGTADRAAPDGTGLLPAVPVTAGLREVGALGLAGPRARLAGLARAVLAQLAALHSPDTLEIVLIGADPSRPVAERTAEWSWLGWLPHVRPGHGQDCRLLLAYDLDQATARTDELLRRLEDLSAEDRHGSVPGIPAQAAPGDPAHRDRSRGAARRPSWARDGDGEGEGFPGPYTVVVVDGDPGDDAVRAAVARLALEGPRAGIHLVCLAETAAASPSSPVTETYEAACAVSPAFRECGAVALLSGDVATALRLMRVARTGPARAAEAPAPINHGTVATVDAVSLPWAERFARALAPLRPEAAADERHTRVSAPLPQAARLLDELGLARATPASLMARWADAADDPAALGGRVCAVLGAGPRGPVGVDLAAEGPHLLIEGPAGSGRTELLRAVVASLAAAERPDRLGIVLVDGRGGTGAGGGPGDGLRVCTDVPHVTTHLTASDPVRMREFAQSLSAELKRRAELLGRSDFAEWHAGRVLSGRLVAQRGTPARGGTTAGDPTGDLDSPASATLRLRPGRSGRRTEAAPPLPRLVVVVDDLDALVSPALGSPGRPAAGSVMRALEAVAREGERLGVHLVAATGPGGRAAQSEPARQAALRITLDAPAPGRAGVPLFEGGRDPGGEPAPGRGRLTCPDGSVIPFQGGRVTGRIPRTATLRPTVVPLEWHRMGDPPARRPVRELGNGPTDLALLASALERAAREVAAVRVPSLL